MEKLFGERLSNLIVKKRMTQREVALKSGVTESALSHYIKGDRVPRADALAEIARSLGTTVDYLMYGKEDDIKEEIEYAKQIIARNISNISKEEKLSIISILLEK